MASSRAGRGWRARSFISTCARCICCAARRTSGVCGPSQSAPRHTGAVPSFNALPCRSSSITIIAAQLLLAPPQRSRRHGWPRVSRHLDLHSAVVAAAQCEHDGRLRRVVLRVRVHTHAVSGKQAARAHAARCARRASRSHTAALMKAVATSASHETPESSWMWPHTTAAGRTRVRTCVARVSVHTRAQVRAKAQHAPRASRSRSSQPACSRLRATKSPCPAGGPCTSSTSVCEGISAHLAAMFAPRRSLNAPQKRGWCGVPHTRKSPRAVVTPASSR